MKWRPYLKYKQLGVEWVGEVPEQWSIRRIKTALSRHDGGGGAKTSTPKGRSCCGRLSKLSMASGGLTTQHGEP